MATVDKFWKIIWIQFFYSKSIDMVKCIMIMGEKNTVDFGQNL